MAELVDDVQFLEFVVKSLVDHPEEVKIQRTVDEMGVLMTLDVHPDDMGKIIGRQGNTAKAIRILLRVVGMKQNARVNLKISEPVGGMGPGAGQNPGPRDSFAKKSIDEAMEDLNLD